MARSATAIIWKDGAFMDGSVHCMSAVSRGAHFGTDLAAQVVATASAVIFQLPDQRLSVRDAKSKTGPVSFFTQELADVVRALCDALRSAHASASERLLWPTSLEYAGSLANRSANTNRSSDGGGGDGDSCDHRGGGGGGGRDRRGSFGRIHHGGPGHNSGGGGNGRRMGPAHRGKGGGHSRSSGGKSGRQNSGGGPGYHTSDPPSDSSEGAEVGAPPPDVKVVQPHKRQVPSLVDAASTER